MRDQGEHLCLYVCNKKYKLLLLCSRTLLVWPAFLPLLSQQPNFPLVSLLCPAFSLCDMSGVDVNCPSSHLISKSRNMSKRDQWAYYMTRSQWMAQSKGCNPVSESESSLDCVGTKKSKMASWTKKETCILMTDFDSLDLAMTVSEGLPGEGNGNPLQYSCLENPMDRGAWQATVHGVAKSQIQLSD